MPRRLCGVFFHAFSLVLRKKIIAIDLREPLGFMIISDSRILAKGEVNHAIVYE